MPVPYDVSVFYFPNYHADPRNDAAHGKGWTEWELVKRAEPKFPGHVQPKIPLWGYEDEADPAVMARKIAAAADHGVRQFIFDWYWYDDGPFLNRCLEDGFLKAENVDRLGFSLMWANHNWTDIHPAKRGTPPVLLYPGTVTEETFDRVCDYVIERYFQHPSYYKIDGCPFFSFYELMTLIRGLGGTEAARLALLRFREKAKAAGFPDVHLNAVVWGVQILPGEEAIKDPAHLLTHLGFDSVTSYVWVHHVQLTQFPETPYAQVMDEAAKYWSAARAEFPLPYFPNVTMGWDPSPRTVQSDALDDSGYPLMAMMSGNTPAEFRDGLERAKRFLDTQPDGPRLLTINAWNEWTEGSYLEPDTVHGFGYLEAIRDVFVPVCSTVHLIRPSAHYTRLRRTSYRASGTPPFLFPAHLQDCRLPAGSDPRTSSAAGRRHAA